MTSTVPNLGNKALLQEYALLRSLIACTPVDWLVVLANPRCEERALLGLLAKGFVTYRPMVPDLRIAKNSKKAIDASKAMFARYIFVGIDRNNRLSTDEIRSCHGVEKILTFREDQAPHRVPAEQILNIAAHAQEAQLGKISVVGHGFEIGDGVIIISGKANFMKGKIEDLNKEKGMARVNLKMFGSQRVVNVPVDKLDLV